MYQCYRCEEVFDEPVRGILVERSFGKGYDIIGCDSTCPECGSGSITELSLCECCGDNYVEALFEDGTVNQYVELCVDCQRKARELFEDARKRFPELNVGRMFDAELENHWRAVEKRKAVE